MDYHKLSEMLYPKVTETPESLEARFPRRNLPEGAKVTRFAPSPTGFVHMGALFPCTVSSILAKESGGVFYLRIEDTDDKRAVEGGVEEIIATLSDYGISFDEGPSQGGGYGPYSQRARVEFYHAYAKNLVSRGLAYPCFCSEEELTHMRSDQEAQKTNYGYYGGWAICRDLSFDSIAERLLSGASYVLRLRASHESGQDAGTKSKSEPDIGSNIMFDDPAKGRIEMPPNDIDHVLLKSDGVPTYHFAHAVDDHLMGTTHVVRGDEWIATYPLHHMLFDLLGFKRPKYIHLAPLMKTDGGGKRKLSKRKDPECALSWYAGQGYPVQTVQEYIMTLLNSNFEDWRRANPTAGLRDFPFSPKKMNAAGALFDLQKLDDVSKNVVSRMTAEEVYTELTAWAERFDPAFFTCLTRDPAYTVKTLSIGRGGNKPRKDFGRWGEAKEYLSFFFDELFTPAAPPDPAFCKAYAEGYDPGGSQEEWFASVKALGERHGYCPDVKQYKSDPADWKGSVADASASLRLAVTGRENSPDLYQVMQILGQERVIGRLKA
ncbi:MAG: glutamate--tRNA ligase family protein [Oscillospiraceae bacterium]|nr:glutamate--tRNA ligase family protein [Oscillospiraceae bacterium]